MRLFMSLLEPQVLGGAIQGELGQSVAVRATCIRRAESTGCWRSGSILRSAVKVPTNSKIITSRALRPAIFR